MLDQVLLVIHIAVLGYWLGADLVINSTYRYVCWSAGMPFDERNRLMDHVMKVDQHVRYALVLQFCLGPSIAALRGYLPGGHMTLAAAAVVAVAWIVLVELVFRLRHQPAGRLLDRIDLAAWILAGLGALLAAAAAATGWLALPGWLTWKLVLFGGVFIAGVGIRIELMKFFAAWTEVGERGSTPEREADVRQGYIRASAVLLGLWVLIGGIVVLSVWKLG